MAADLIPQSVDLIADSLSGLLAVVFPRSRAIRYPLAVQLAQSASKYSETALGGVPWHLAAFARDQTQAALAMAIIRALAGQKADYFVRGVQVKQPVQLARVLECYLQACACADTSAHCVRVIGDPYTYDGTSPSLSAYNRQREPLYHWPCAFMLRWNTPALQHPHPSTPVDQIQARAVTLGCDACPLFRAELKPAV